MSTTNRIGAVTPPLVRSIFVGNGRHVAPDAAVRVTLTADANADTKRASVVLEGAKLKPPMSAADLANVASITVPEPWGDGGAATFEKLPRGVLRLETGVMDGAGAWLKAPPMVQVTMKDGTGRLLQLEPSTIGHNRGPFELAHAQEQIRTLGQILTMDKERLAMARGLLASPEQLPKGLLADLAEARARLDGRRAEVDARTAEVTAVLDEVADPTMVHVALIKAKGLTGTFPPVTRDEVKAMVADAKKDPATWAKLLAWTDTLFFKDSAGHSSGLLTYAPQYLERDAAELAEREATVPARRAAEVKSIEESITARLAEIAERTARLEQHKKNAANLTLSPSIVTVKTEYP